MTNTLGDLLRRLREDGGRYLLSVGLTREERKAQPEPTFGGKGHVRWLTDEEYRALCALVPSDETNEGYSHAYADQMRMALLTIATSSLTPDRVRQFAHKGLLRSFPVESSGPLRTADAQGWTLDNRLIRAIHDECRGDDFCPSDEGIELVLLAFEKLTARRLADYGSAENQPRELTLQDFGYAPGNYAIKCLDCGQESLGCAKRAARCETCAKQALAGNRKGFAGRGSDDAEFGTAEWRRDNEPPAPADQAKKLSDLIDAAYVAGQCNSKGRSELELEYMRKAGSLRDELLGRASSKRDQT